MRSKCARPAAMLLFATVMASACATTDDGFGSSRAGGDAPVMFSWRSEDGVSGQITATTPEGRSLVGKYFQITSDTRLDSLAPLWDGWGPEQRGWPFWYTQPGPQFVDHYRGRVLANLSASDGEPMWCSLRLLEPSSGMAGGGEGVCQLRNGETIDAMFPPRLARSAQGERRRGPAAVVRKAASSCRPSTLADCEAPAGR